MTPTEMLARIAALETQLRKPAREDNNAKAREKARRKQFKIDAWKRARRHLSINRYSLAR